MENVEIKEKKKTGPKGPFKYPKGCYNDESSPSYKPNKGIGRGKAVRQTYKNKKFVRITIEEYDDLLACKNKQLSN